MWRTDLLAGPTEALFEQAERCARCRSGAGNACHIRSTSTGVAFTRDHHSHTGFGIAPLGRRSTSKRITVSSITGSSASSAQATRRVNRGCSRSHATAARDCPAAINRPTLGDGEFLYLATVLGCFSRGVVGRSIAGHMRTDLVANVLKMAAV
ncbi:hypothetical protein GCM10022224_088610 [Nonomuraea antimicrobica]|uniref:Uncharacterized protein n=1 Tax=Nonomuraea antimicrobica TaxID=561173 RepID=A0ABP7DUP1_9ACTN